MPQFPQSPAQPQVAPAPQPIIINNNVAASAAAIAGGGYRGKRKQSFWVHFWLLLFTAGIGNVCYAVHISNWNKKRGLY